MATSDNPLEIGGGWFIDPNNPRRAIYPGEDGTPVFEAEYSPPDSPLGSPPDQPATPPTPQLEQQEVQPNKDTPISLSPQGIQPRGSVTVEGGEAPLPETAAPTPQFHSEVSFAGDQRDNNVLKQKAGEAASVLGQMLSDPTRYSDEQIRSKAKEFEQQGFSVSGLDRNLEARAKGTKVDKVLLDPKFDDPLGQADIARESVQRTDEERQQDEALRSASPALYTAERALRYFKEASQYGFPGYVARSFYDWGNYGVDELKRSYPGYSDEWYEEMSKFVVQNMQKSIRLAYREEASKDPNWRPDESWWQNVSAIDRWGPAFVGMALGSAGPESLVNPGSTATTRILSQGAAAAVAEGGYQALDYAQNVSDQLDAASVLVNAATGAGLQGVFEIPGFIRDLYTHRGHDTTPVDFRDLSPEAMETIQAPIKRPYSDKYRSPSQEGAVRRAYQEASQDKGVPISELTKEDVIPFLGEKNAELLERNPFTKKADRPAFEDQKQAEFVQDLDNRVSALTKNWTNAPKFEVVYSANDIVDPAIRQAAISAGADADGLGFLGPDGKVRIIGKNIQAPEDLVGVTFHEGLGHFGLLTKFGDDLNRILSEFYNHNSSPSFTKAVDKWLADHPESYKGDPNRLERGAEEVLAEFSEGGRVPVSLLNRLKNSIKDLGRSMGLDFKYSKREIETILGMAHDAVINGHGGNAVANGFRFSRVWHGSGADFEKFDHSKIGTGEGAQVYGWGTYLAESRKVGETYRNAIGGGSPSWRGVEAPWYTTRSNMEHSVKQAFPDVEGSDVVAGDVFDYIRDHGGNKPTSEQVASRILSGREFSNLSSMDLPALRREVEKTSAQIKPIVDYVNERLSLNRKGSLYEVEIPDDAKWLLWDEPYNKQPQELKDFLEGLVGKENILSRREANSLDDELSEAWIKESTTRERYNDMVEQHGPYSQEALSAQGDLQSALSRSKELEERRRNILVAEDTTGQDIYDQLVSRTGSPEEASKLLDENGISGNKYLDGSSRGAGRGTYNYVVFNENTPEVVNKFMRRRHQETPESQGNKEDRLHNLPGLDPSKIKTTEDISEHLFEMAATVSRRPNITDDDVAATALSMGLTPKKVAQRQSLRGKRLTEYMYAAEEAATRQFQRVVDLEKRLSTEGYSATVHARAIEEMATLKAVLSHVSGDRSELGRAMRVLQKIHASRKAKGGGARIEELLEGTDLALLSDPEQFNKFMRLLKEQIDLGNSAGGVRLIKDVFDPKIEDKVFRVWYNMLLSNPATHFRNFTGTGGHLALDLMTKTGAAVFGQRGRFSNADRVRAREVAYRMWGLIQGIRSGATWAKAREALNTGITGNTPNAKTGESMRGSHVYSGEDSTLGFVSGALEGPSRALAGVDEWWRNVLQASSMYGLAVRNAGNKGLRGKKLWEEVENLIANPTKEMIEDTDNYTRTIQFLDKPSKIAKAIINTQTPKSGDGAITRSLRAALKTVLPFVRTPDSLIRATLRHSPLGALERENVRQWKAGGAERDQVKARMLMSSAVLFWIASQAYADNISGEGPSNPAKRQAWESNHQPNSIKVGGKWRSIEGLEPVSSLITAPATLVERIKAGEVDTGDAIDTAASSVHAVASVIKNISYLDSLNTIIGVAGDDKSQASSVIRNWVASTVSSGTTPAIVRRFAQSLDPAVRDTTGSGSSSDRIAGRIQSGVPGASRELPQRYDVYGRPVTRGFTGPDMLAIGTNKTPSDDPIISEIARLEDKENKIVLGPPKRTKIKVNGEVVDRLNDKQFQAYQGLSGFWAVEMVRDFSKENKKEWDGMSDSDRADLIREATTKARESAREYLFNSSGEGDPVEW